ncbi:MAG: serine/threonine-protein kinase, partial [Planctomycetota bacterium]
MSVVFRATQLSLNRNVALKVLRKDLGGDSEFSRRFLAEAKALAELNHPHIVSVFDQGVYRGNHYLVMEHIEGVSLREVLSERRLNPAEALRLIPKLCSALEYAHDRGIIHRDIKPENILLDRAGTPKIADFGLVRIIGRENDTMSRITKTQTVMGTLDYMAPEQREGNRNIDHRADIYSLGVVFYEMLTGELPIANFPRPSERVEVDVRIDEVVLKILSKDRELRYQRASLVATDLERIENGDYPQSSAEGTPRTIAGRLLHMGTSFPFFFFTLVFLAVCAAGNEEPASLFAGLAVPFYMAQLILHGILPRPVFPRTTFVFRHPIFSFALVTLFCIIMTANNVFDEEAGLFFIGLSASCGLCLAFWRKKVFRQPGEPRYGPWTGAPEAITPSSDQEKNHSDRLAAQAASGAAAMAKAAAQAVHATAKSLRPAPQSVSEGSPPSRPEPPLTEKKTPPAPPVEPKTRFSALTVLAFLLTLVTLLASTLFAVGLLGLDWPTHVSHLVSYGVDYTDLKHGLAQLWQTPSSEIFSCISAAAWLPCLVVPLAPVLLLLLALPGLIRRKRRGAPLYLVTVGLLVVELALLLTGSAEVSNRMNRYVHDFRNEPSSWYLNKANNDPVTAALMAASEVNEPLERFALFHRSVKVSGGESVSLTARAPLVKISLSRDATALERMASLALLQEFFPTDLFVDPQDYDAPDDWVRHYTDLAQRQKFSRSG